MLRRWLSLWGLDHPERTGPIPRVENVDADEVLEEHSDEVAVRDLHHGPYSNEESASVPMWSLCVALARSCEVLDYPEKVGPIPRVDGVDANEVPEEQCNEVTGYGFPPELCSTEGPWPSRCVFTVLGRKVAVVPI